MTWKVEAKGWGMQCEDQVEGSVPECQVGTVSLAWDLDQWPGQSEWRAVVDRWHVGCLGMARQEVMRLEGRSHKWEVTRVSSGS